MFGFMDDVLDIGKDVLNGGVDTVAEFIDHPIDKSIEMAIQPVVDGIDILDGLSEGEIREKAALRLGVDVVSGMALGEVVEYLVN